MKEIWKRKSTKIVVAAVVIVVIAALAGLLVRSGGNRAVKNHLELAAKYISELDYEQAIAEYKAALEIDPQNQQAIDGMEQVCLEYVAQLTIETETVTLEECYGAVEVLEQGYALTQKPSLQEKKEELLQLAEELEARTSENAAEQPDEAEAEGSVGQETAETEESAERETLTEQGTGTETESETEETETKQKESETKESETERGASIIDLKDYPYILPEDLGGNLAETLANAIYPKNPAVGYDESGYFYVIGNGSIETGASMNNDGFFVFVYDYVDNFFVYGLQVGMTEELAVQILSEQGITGNETQEYVIDGNAYISLDVTDGIIDRITYAFHFS